jgi:hypothetical protein
LFWIISRPFTLVARNLEGARDHSYERFKCRISPVGTMEPRGRKIGRHILATTEDFCCFGYFDDFSRSLLGCWRASETTAMSRLKVVSYQWTIWKQAGGILDVTTNHIVLRRCDKKIIYSSFVYLLLLLLLLFLFESRTRFGGATYTSLFNYCLLFIIKKVAVAGWVVEGGLHKLSARVGSGAYREAVSLRWA